MRARWTRRRSSRTLGGGILTDDSPMRDASLPVALIVVGLGWLLWEFRLFPDLDWIIALGFVIGGVLVLVLDGINKNSVVIGPFLVGIGVAWFLHDR